MLGKWWVMPAAIAAAVLVPNTAPGGDFHFGATLVCSDCHVMHYSQSHGYNPDGTGFWTPLAGGPHGLLLRQDINDLCLACHDGSAFAPDVKHASSNGYVRQAGALNDGTDGAYPDASGHTLGSTATAPGSNPAWSNPDGLGCTNCHQPHGAGFLGAPGSYRNLGGFGTGSGLAPQITYTRGDVEGANPLSAWVHEDASSGTSVTHYGFSAITFNEPVLTESAYADFCKSCHTDFHGAVGGGEIGGSGTPPEHFDRHPNLTVNIGALGGGHSSMGVFTGHTNQVQVMSPTGQKAGGYDGTDTGLTPSCFSCHKGHGNKNAFGIIHMAGSGTITEEGDDGTAVRDACKQCHVQGG